MTGVREAFGELEDGKSVDRDPGKFQGARPMFRRAHPIRIGSPCQ